MVLDGVESLRATVQQLERQGDKVSGYELIEARARLAEAEGRPGAAADEWKKLVTYHQERIAGLKKLASQICSPIDFVEARGCLADARCKVADVERDWATLAAELPNVIAWYEKQLEIYERLRERGEWDTEFEEAEKYYRSKLSKAQTRLEIIRKKAGPP
jgi:hypothetical protein